MVRIEIGDIIFYANEKAYNIYKKIQKQKEEEFLKECLKILGYESLS